MYNIIDGNLISKKILDDCQLKINNLLALSKKIKLCDIIVGNDAASIIYAKNKKKKFNDYNIDFDLVELSNDITEQELIDKILEFNTNNEINGIFIEMPLPKHINSNKIINMIDPKKDVDGMNQYNLGSILNNGKGFYPCTAEGIVRLLKEYNIDLTGKHCVIVGRSVVVGKPVGLLLLNENATVTICHSKTENLKEICKLADILIVAIGKANFIDDSFISENAIVIDAGINRIKDNEKQKIVGDVNFDKVSIKSSYITPVPGGVGPMTTAILICHCLKTISNE